MNIIFNTPLLNSTSLKRNFDNKILAIFLILIAVLVMLGVLFVDFTSAFGNNPAPGNPAINNRHNYPKLPRFA